MMKTFPQKLGVMLLILASVVLCLGIRDWFQIRPATAYVDEGIFTFVPNRTYPVQRRSTATGRQRRMHPTKIVHVVEYKSTESPHYKWPQDAPGETSAKQTVAEKVPIQRRVLSVKDERKIAIIEPELTPESYVSHLRRRAGWMIGLSAVYLVLYLGGWWLRLQKQRQVRAATEAEFALE